MAMILDAFVSRFVEQLVKLVEDEVALLLDVTDEIQKLQRTLRKISNVLADAERRRADDKTIDDWLKELKDVMYDADDILDLCRIEADKDSTMSPGQPPAAAASSSSSVRCHFPLFSCFREVTFTHQIGDRIRTLNARLEEISKARSVFDLKLSRHGDDRVGQISHKTSSIVEPDIVGARIDEVTRSLVQLLTNEDRRENLLVLAIVGIGGIGKTTLAQKIFDDQKIEDDFQLRMWVCVSQEFSEIDLLRDIISGTGGNHGGAQSRALLEPMVKSAVSGKKFLLVLDDVWTHQVWDELLRKPLNGCAPGSRILVTTRNEGIAKQMKAVHVHRVSLLSPADGWSLLCKKVALSGEEGEIDGLKDVGMEIIGNCGGLPLAIKAVAGVLCTKKRTRSAWKEVLQSSAWSVTGLPEGVHGALYLSYIDLPSHLKQCFVYCGLFPEDYVISQARIVEAWIAEGFIKSEGNSSMEELGDGNYRELVSRNLLQPSPHYYDQAGSKMHYLLRSLARFLTRDESLVVRPMQQGVNNSTSPMKLRRLSVVGGKTREISDVLKKQGESLRTLIVFRTNKYDLEDLCNSFSRLRVLNLVDNALTVLPDSLGTLIHLRLLNLSGSRISRIPESIGNLRNLQFLILQQCRDLHQLPKNVVCLHNLRTLDLYGTEVNGIPKGIGRLQHLRRLSCYSAGVGCTLEELKHLSQLRVLAIGKLERASTDSAGDKGAPLASKPHLTYLQLSCTPPRLEGERCTMEEMKRIEDVFEELCPPPCIETTTIQRKVRSGRL